MLVVLFLMVVAGRNQYRQPLAFLQGKIGDGCGFATASTNVGAQVPNRLAPQATGIDGSAAASATARSAAGG
jgi:hypothetical protein